MASTMVNIEALYAALDRERDKRHISWRELAKEAKLSPSTLSRIRNGDARPSVEAFAALTKWLGASSEDFLRRDPDKREPELETQLTALLRARSDLDAQQVRALEDVISAAVKLVKAQRARA